MIDKITEGRCVMKRALLINDSKFERLILKDLLSKLEYTIEITDEFDAVEMVEDFDPDLVIVNYVMEEITGDQLIEKIKDIQPEIRCILSSSNKIHLEDFQEQGVDAVLQTPVSKFRLQQVLEGLEQGTQNTPNLFIQKYKVDTQEYPVDSEKIQEADRKVVSIPSMISPVHIQNKMIDNQYRAEVPTPIQKNEQIMDEPPQYAFCPHCGIKLDATIKIQFHFCPYCGKNL